MMAQIHDPACKDISSAPIVGHGRVSPALAALFFSALILCLFAYGEAHAKGKTYPGLDDGFEVLSAYRGLNPKAGEVLDKMMDRAPADVKQKAKSSNWAQEQNKMTPGQLGRAVNDQDMTLIPTADGLAALPNSKLTRGMNALTDFAIDQKDIGSFLNDIKGQVSPGIRKVINKLTPKLNQIQKAKNSGDLFQTAKILVIKGGISFVVVNKINEQSEEIREDFKNLGAAKTLEKYRKKAKENKDQIARLLAKAKKEREEAERKKRDAAAKKAAAVALRKAEAKKINDLARALDKDLTEMDPNVASLEGVLKRCQSLAGTIPPNLSSPSNLGSRVWRESLQRDAVEDAINQAQRVSSTSQALNRLISQAEQAAAKACKQKNASSGSLDAQKLDSIGSVARGAYEAIKAELESAIAALGKPVDVGRLQTHVQPVRAREKFCSANPDLNKGSPKVIGLTKDNVNAAIKIVDLKGKIEQRISDLETLTSPFDALDMHSLLQFKIRLAQLIKRTEDLDKPYKECKEQLRSAGDACKNVTSGAADKADAMIAELEALERRRKDTLQRVRTILSTLESDYSAAKQAVTDGKACLANPSDSTTNAGSSESGDTPDTDQPRDVAGSGISEADAQEICKRRLLTNRARAVFRDGRWRCIFPTTTDHERDARATCRQEYGRGSLPNLNQSSYKTYVCYCITGYRMNEGKTYCIRDPQRTASPGPGKGQPSGAGSGGSGASSSSSGSSSSSSSSGTGGAATSAGADEAGGADDPCPPTPGWVLPTGAKCGPGPAGPMTASGGAATPQPATPGSAASAPQSKPPSNSGFGSGCGPAPTCKEMEDGKLFKNCKPVHYVCSNGGWIGGHCECSGS